MAFEIIFGFSEGVMARERAFVARVVFVGGLGGHISRHMPRTNRLGGSE